MAGRVRDQLALNTSPSLTSQNWLYAGIVTLILAVLFLDLLTPPEFTAGLFIYYFAIFLSSRLRAERAPLAVAVIVSACVLLGFLASTDRATTIEVATRLVILGTLWGMTALAYRRIVTNREFINLRGVAESLERLRSMIADSSLAIQILDRGGKQLFVNQAFLDLMGYGSPEEIMDVPPMTLVAPHDRAMTHKNLLDFIRRQEGVFPSSEFDGVRKDGSPIRLQVVMQDIEWDGTPAVQRTLIDVSDRQKTQAALEESEGRYRDLCEHLRLGLVIASDRGILLANNAYIEWLGYDSAEEFLKIGRYGAIAPYDLHRAPTMKNVSATPEAERPASYKIDQVRKDGSIVPVEIFSRLFEWKGERAVQNIIVDLSERQRAEEALAASERQFRELFEDLQLGLMISKQHGKSMVNKALVDMLGYHSADELMATERQGDLAPHDRHRALTLERIEREGHTLPPSLEFDLMRKDGTIVPVDVFWRVFEWEGQKAVQRIFVDLTDRKRAEAALEESERQYRDLIERSPLGIQIATARGARVLVNNALATMLGYNDNEEVMALPDYSLVAPYHRGRATAFREIARPNYRFLESDELDFVCKDGSIRTTQVFRRKLIWQGEDAIQLTYIDLTERKRAEAALVESEERYRKLFEESPLGIRITDENGNRQANHALAKMLGYDSVEELLILPKKALIAPDHLDRAITYERIRTDRDSVPASVELDIIKKDGSLLPVQVFWRTLEWRGLRAVERTYIDISERKAHEHALRERDRTVRELRQELAQASQIGAMGEIASVIAHELHQPLTAIANTASAAQRRLSEKDADKTAVLNEMLPLISSQANRAGRVIGGIRKLFDGRRTERSLEEINLVVAEACELTTNEFKADAMNITQHFTEISPSVVIDRVQIQQVIYNLLRNAVDALHESTTKIIVVSIEKTDNEMIQISVQNEGPSLPDHIRSKLFDPFFTTRENGMGMGLYTCQRIVDAHEGDIWLESDDKSGTIVRFTLPVTKQTVNPTGKIP